MDRIPKLFLIVIVLSALASCGIFFTPMDGRWSTADPKNELLTFEPLVAGYVDGQLTGFQSDSLDSYYKPGIDPTCCQIILLRFDTGDFPRVVAASHLRLTGDPEKIPDLPVLEIYRINKDWDPTRITFGDVVSGDFYDDSVVTSFSIPGDVVDIQIPLGDVFSGEKEKLANGVVICSSESMSFYPKDDFNQGPVLLVEPE
jgi:hypothetical protein